MERLDMFVTCIGVVVLVVAVVVMADHLNKRLVSWVETGEFWSSATKK